MMAYSLAISLQTAVEIEEREREMEKIKHA
jgi:hypothetical protein